MAPIGPLVSAGSARGERRAPATLTSRRTTAAAARASRLTIVLIAAALLAGCAVAARAKTSGSSAPTASTPARTDEPQLGAPVDVPEAPTTVPALAVPAPLTSEGLSLRAGPVPVPLQLQIPSLGVSAPVLGVGITSKNVMDAPMGPANDPVWQEAFWYRGSAVPGAQSTALIAGHVSAYGRLDVFGHIDRLQPGDLIVIHDTRSGLDVRFSVTDSMSYSLAQTADPAILTQIYGVGPVKGTGPQPSADGLAHLSLITCAGTFTNGTHDHRLVVYATRVG
jgi:sortase (surface protein transpeptidase)